MYSVYLHYTDKKSSCSLIYNLTNYFNMIKTFSNKDLKSFWNKGDGRKLPPKSLRKIQKILNILDSVNTLPGLNPFVLKYRIHPLKKPPYIGFISFDVDGPYRIYARFQNGDFYDLDYLDPH